MVSRKSHILIWSAALSTLTIAGGAAAAEFAARGPSVPSAPAPAYVVTAMHAPAPAAHELEAGDQS
jgi:hypothetical protein